MNPIVLCVHRSGSSAITGVLHHLGINMGDEMLGPELSNPKGHFEDLVFFSFGVDYLESRGGNWLEPPSIDKLDSPTSSEQQRFLRIVTSKFENNEKWGWKDPRTILYIKNFYMFVPDPLWIWVDRPEHAIIGSLQKRNPNIPETIYKKMYDFYQDRYTEFNALLGGMLVIDYHRLLERPKDGVEEIAKTLDVYPTMAAINFLDKNLRNH